MAEPQIFYSGPVVSAYDAMVTGAKRYFTGEPCKRGHVCQRYVSNGVCLCCLDARNKSLGPKNYERVKAWRKVNPEKRTEEARRYYARHPDKVAAKSRRYREKNGERLRPIEAKRARIRRANNPDAERARFERWKAKRDKRYADEAGRPRPSTCDLCKKFNRQIVFDHCHRHGHFRGWLCDRCNKVLGLVKDKPTLLRAMARYVEKSNGSVNREEPERTPIERLCAAE